MNQLQIPGIETGWETIAGHWHVGSNMVGYLPESDVFCADNLQQAVEFFGSQLQSASEECQDMCAEIGDGHVGCEWSKLGREIDKIADMIVSGELQKRLKDNGSYGYIFTPPEGADISYWINPVASTRQDEADGKYSRADICETNMDQNDWYPFDYKCEAQNAPSKYWGMGHYLVHADRTVIGRVCRDSKDGTWFAYPDYTPPTPGKNGERIACGERLRTRDEAVRALWVYRMKEKQDGPK